jgi:hypothetical protein
VQYQPRVRKDLPSHQTFGGFTTMRSQISELDLQPHTEGVTHIRVGTASRTPLGRLLANEARTPFDHPRLGKFESLEGFWAFVGAGGSKNPLRAPHGIRTLYGIPAMRATIHTEKRHDPNFRKMICEGLDCKIEQTPGLTDMLRDNELELVRYNVFEREPILDPNQRWFMEHLATIVKRLKCQKRR